MIYREVKFIDERAYFIYWARRIALRRVYMARSGSTIWGCVCTPPRPELFFRGRGTRVEKLQKRRRI